MKKMEVTIECQDKDYERLAHALYAVLDCIIYENFQIDCDVVDVRYGGDKGTD